MEQLTQWLQDFGPFGLFLAACLDSFVPLGHVVDPMVVYLSHTSGDPVLYAGLAVLGSVLGTTVLFALVRKGGHAFVERRLSDSKREQLSALLERYGLLTVIVGGILPPPFPFKGVVLVSGLARMPLGMFVAGVVIARVFRYGLESTLAVLYGAVALSFMREHYAAIGLSFVAITVVVWFVAQRLLRSPVAAPAE